MAGLYLNHVKVAEESGGIVSLPNTVQFNNLKIGGTEVINSNRQIQNITGIDFSPSSGTGTPSSNLLDDYEEGSWTPALNFGGGIAGITYNQSFGRYTKVGNLVHAQFVIILSSKGSSSGTAQITGLPFDPILAYTSFYIYSDRVTVSGGVVTGYIASGTQIVLYDQVSGGNSTLNNNAFVNNSYITAVFTYTTA